MLQSPMHTTRHDQLMVLIDKHCRMLIYPQSIICIKKGLEFFKEERPELSSSYTKYLGLKRDEAQQAMALYGLSFDTELPGSPGGKNRLWREEIKPRLKAAQETIKRQRVAKELGLSPDATKDEVEEAVINKKRKMAEEKRLRKAKDKEQERCQKAKAEEEEKLRQAKAEKVRALFDKKERKRLGLSNETDVTVAKALCEGSINAIASALKYTSVYLYFKVWVVSENTRWYKVGITNDLTRRDTEQNVLPVPAETIKAIVFPNNQAAASVEQVFHEVLSRHRIKGAGNRELFALEPIHVTTIIDAMKSLEQSLPPW
jgi:hypothetical protein